MFSAEHGYQVAKSKSAAEGRKCLQADGQKTRWPTNEPCGAEPALPEIHGKFIYAENAAYLEVANPAWEKQDLAVLGTLCVAPCAFLIIWLWYGLSIHPLIFDRIIIVFGSMPYKSGMAVMSWTSWLLLFPLSLGSALLLYLHFYINGAHTVFFTYARARIRFNRLTRKVYVLRPKACGGNSIFDWERLTAIIDHDGYDLFTRKNLKPGTKLPYYALMLYHPPFDPNDPLSAGEDGLFVGPSLFAADEAPPLWEYIRRYMEDGPGISGVPVRSPLSSSTFCGIPSGAQRHLEDPFANGGLFFWLSVVTCSWPKFPPQWHSDSGIGEPEDKPVQTGAVMTALVYRNEGRLSKADEIEFMTHYGSAEGLADAIARPNDM